MINHHPTAAVLSDFVSGDLPASVSVVVASHLEMCQHCRSQVAELTEQAAQALFERRTLGPLSVNEEVERSVSEASVALDSDLLSMMDSITTQKIEEAPVRPKIVRQIEVADLRLPLPRAMRSIHLKDWQGIGKLSRSRLDLEDQNLKASLLYIDKGGSIPSHTHKGFEITLLLQGSFSDEMGSYHEGDFLWLDGQHVHHPVTEEGCVCLTVSSDAIHFTQGMSQLFNPIGKFIY